MLQLNQCNNLKKRFSTQEFKEVVAWVVLDQSYLIDFCAYGCTRVKTA
ncbi:hypothetical protein HALA3H3_250026 [Halomonas sp. A3H3]|nr:hypothetical protein HALA3H3_250026 [Halomonas sp. A3H3]